MKSRASGTYGVREKRRVVETGARRVAPTYGKARFRTSSAQTGVGMLVESDAERFVAHILRLSPSVARFEPQPMVVDLVDGCVHWSAETVAEARRKHRLLAGPKFYVPDFAVEWLGGQRGAIETKHEKYQGDSAYAQKLARAKSILADYGYDFVRAVVPEHPLNPLRSNVSLLTKASARKDLWPTEDQIGQVEQLCAGQSVPLATVCQELGISASLLPSLLVRGVVSADIAKFFIRGDMMLHAAYGDLTHLDLLMEIAQ